MARTLVDSSVWIDFLRSGKSKAAVLLDDLLAADEVSTTWIIRVELLSGARNEPEYETLEKRLASVPILEFSKTFWNDMARTRFRVARAGFQASIPDLAIGMLARLHNCPLLTLDRPLIQIAKILPFKLYPYP